MVRLQVGSLSDEEVLLVLLELKASLSVPRCHFRQDFHQRGRLSLLFSNSKHASGLCHVSLFQLGQCFPGPLPGTSTPPPPFLVNASIKVTTFFARRVLVSVRAAIVMVRKALDLTSPSNTPLPVTATPTKLSKQPSNSSTVAGVGRPARGSFPPTAPPSAALPNYSASFTPAWIRMVSFISAFL